MSLPEELERREARLAAIAEAKARIKERVAEREQAEYQEKLAARAEKERRTGKKPGGRPPAPPSGGVEAKERCSSGFSMSGGSLTSRTQSIRGSG